MDIKKALKAHGQTVSSMATQLGITQPALSQQINNNSITYAKVEKIASLCGCSVVEFIESAGDGVESPTSLHKCPHCGEPIIVELKK